jgi:WD40 repeat protein
MLHKINKTPILASSQRIHEKNFVKNSKLDTFNCLKLAFNTNLDIRVISLPLNENKESSALCIIHTTTDDTVPNHDHNDWITCLLLLPLNNQLASGSDDSNIKIWQIIKGKKEINLIRTLQGHTNSINSLIHDNLNQTILSGSEDDTIRVWNYVEGICLRVLNSNRIIRNLCIYNTFLITSSNDSSIRIWDFNMDACVSKLKGHTDVILSLLILKHTLDRLVSSSCDSTLKLWTISESKCVRTFRGHADQCWRVEEISASEILSSSWDCTLKLWDLNKGYCLKTISVEDMSIFSTMLTLPNGHLITSSWNKENNKTIICLWDLIRLGRVKTFLNEKFNTIVDMILISDVDFNPFSTNPSGFISNSV